MLPSTPRPPPRGLPSNPRPSSRPTTPSRGIPRSSTGDDRPQSSSSARLLGRTEMRTAPLPEFQRSVRDVNPTGSTNGNDNSVSSTTTSLLDRLKPKSGVSSRSSLEEEYKQPRTLLQSESALKSIRRPLSQGNMPPSMETSGIGEAVWNRVANVASTLTVNVSKAWSAQVTTFAGEDTPPGQESRLTRAMKAYHLDKARDPSDLPTWLFDEQEIHPPVKSREMAGNDTQPIKEMPKSRGLREIYDAYQSEPFISRASSRPHKVDDPPPSKTTDRLKALREGKRSAASSTTNRSPQGAANDTAFDNTPPAGGTPRPRVGLPSGPRRV